MIYANIVIGIVCQILLEMKLAQVLLKKGCDSFYFMNKYCKHMSFCFYTIRTCKCRVYMYVILFINHSYCYFVQYAYITNLYICRPVINTCLYLSASNGFHWSLFWIHQLCIIIIYDIIKIILVVVKRVTFGK